MGTVLSLAELEQSVGRDLGTSAWLEIDQERVNLFADATSDHQWIHVDPDTAAKGPFGGTVAHGYLTLSLLSSLFTEILTISGSTMGVNYGIEKIRFPSPVRVGSKIRLHATLLSAERRGEAVQYSVGMNVEIEGSDKPALVGEVVYLAS